MTPNDMPMPAAGAPATLQVSCVQMHWAKSLPFNLRRTLHYVGAAADAGSRVVLFPEATLTSYYFPYVVSLDPAEVAAALEAVRAAARERGIWVIVGTIRKTADRFLNLAHVIDPAGRDRRTSTRRSTWPAATSSSTAGAATSCRCSRSTACAARWSSAATGGIRSCTACPRWPARRSCSIRRAARTRSRRSAGSAPPGRAQQPVGPNSKIFHCVANTVGESPDGKQTSSGSSFIREPNGIPLAEAGYYQEEMITAVLDLARADRSYVRDSLKNPPFLAEHWRRMVADVEARKDVTPE